MFSWKEFEKSKFVLSHVGGDHYRSEWGQHHLEVRPTTLLDWMEFLKEDLGYFTLVDIACVDRGEEVVTRFEQVYHLLNMGTHQRVNLHLFFNEGELVPSICEYYPHADWMEREQMEMFGLKFQRSSLPLLLPKDQKNFPMRKNVNMEDWPIEESRPLPRLPFNPNKSESPYPEESYQWKKFDLFSKETKGNFEWFTCFDPVKVVDSKLNIGFHHQGFELHLESKDHLQILQLVDKMNLNSSPNYSVAWARSLEEIYRIKIPERAQAIRLIMLELARVAEHLTVLAEICLTSHQSEFKLFIDAREKVYELFEKFCGHRQGLGIASLGGIREDLPPGWIVEYQSVSEILSKNLRLIHKSLIGQARFRSILEGESVNAQLVLQWGVSGPAMRAAGLNFDLRKSQPFYFYQDIDFDIPVGIHGSIYDRYLIRYEEIYQSLRIITQVVDNLPLGEFMNEEYNRNYLGVMELLKTKKVDYHWHFSSIESPSGEAGFLVNFNDGFLAPSRIKMKTPSFTIAQALGIFVAGLRYEQLSPALASLGINRLEMDR